MAGLISQETLLRITQASDIVEVITSYLPLKRSGSSWKALCPFHDEKTPSFHVNAVRQFFHCFGCGKKGDVFTFIRERERVGFPEAVRMLADRAGIRLEFDAATEAAHRRKQELFDIQAWAAGHYRRLFLEAPEAAGAREYVRTRGISDASAEAFGLGFAPPAWDGLIQEAARRGTSLETLVESGLAIRNEERGSFYDRFRGRLMFPIDDPRGRVIGFGARTLDGSEPKYLNSPESPLFSKGRNVYGLRRVREAAPALDRILIMEGYTDVIMAAQCGVEGATATLGTALTKDHLTLLRRYARTLVLVYDGDEAGQKASDRSADLLLGEDLEVRIACLPGGDDPCDLLLKPGGVDVFRKCLDEAKDLFQFLLSATGKKHDLETAGGKAQAVNEILDRISRVEDPVRREMLVQKLAAEYRVPESVLREKAARPATGAPRAAAPAATPAPRPRSDDGAWREIAGILLARPDLAEALYQRMSPFAPGGAPGNIHGTGQVEAARRLVCALLELHRQGLSPAGAAAAALLPEDDLRGLALELTVEGPPDERYEVRLAGCLGGLERTARDAASRAIQEALEVARARGDRAEIGRLLAEKQNLRSGRTSPAT